MEAPQPPMGSISPPIESEESACTICLEVLNPGTNEIASTDCGHCFHRDCITNALRRRKECPQCRTRQVNPPIKLWIGKLATSSIQRTDSSENSLQQEVSVLNSRNQRLLEDIARLQQDNQKQVDTNRKTERRLKRYESLLEGAINAEKDALSKIAELESMIESEQILEDSHMFLHGSREEKLKRIEHARKQVSLIGPDQMQTTLCSLFDAIAVVQLEKQSIKIDNDTLKHEIQTLRDQLNTLRADILEKDHSILKLNQQLEHEQRGQRKKIKLTEAVSNSSSQRTDISVKTSFQPIVSIESDDENDHSTDIDSLVKSLYHPPVLHKNRISSASHKRLTNINPKLGLGKSKQLSIQTMFR
jgi:Ring finger domain